MKVPQLSWSTSLFLAGVFAVAQSVQEATAASSNLILSNHPPTESNSLQEGFRQQVDESRQRDLYETCINSADRVERHAHSMMPARIWTFDREKYQQKLDRLRLAAEALSQNQAAFQASLTPQQVSKLDSEIQGVHQLQAELEFRVQSVDHELRKRRPAKWKIAQDTEAIPKLVKAWRKRDQKIARGIDISR